MPASSISTPAVRTRIGKRFRLPEFDKGHLTHMVFLVLGKVLIDQLQRPEHNEEFLSLRDKDPGSEARLVFRR